MSIRNISPTEAKQILAEGSDTVYIDVRTEQEFATGHVPGAINIPVARPNPPAVELKPDPDFIKRILGRFKKEKNIILGCQSGSRSKFAAELLAKAGYRNLCNMDGGLDGTRDNLGRISVPGWRQLGFEIVTRNRRK